MRGKKLTICLLIAILSITQVSCMLKKDKEDKKDKKALSLNILIKANDNSEIMQGYIEKFKESNKDINVDVKEFNELNQNNLKDITDGRIDLILSDRMDLITLEKQGLLTDLKDIYIKCKLEKRMYNTIKNYARIDEIYFGIPMDCRTYEFLLNEEVAKEFMQDPKENKYIENMINSVKEKDIKLPILCGKGIEYEDVIISCAMSSFVNYNNLLEEYDKVYEQLEEKNNIEKGIKAIEEAIKSKVISEKNFIEGTKSDIKKIVSGKIPFIIADSIYLNEINKESSIILTNNICTGNKKIVNLVDGRNIMSIPVVSKNKDSYIRFMEYILDEKNLEFLTQNNIVSFDKFVNERLGGKYKEVSNHINLANENSVIFKYSINKENYNIIKEKISQLLRKE